MVVVSSARRREGCPAAAPARGQPQQCCVFCGVRAQVAAEPRLKYRLRLVQQAVALLLREMRVSESLSVCSALARRWTRTL